MYETVDLNIIPVGEMPVVHCSQYDTNRLIRFVLTDGEDPFTFGVLVSVITTIRKVDGTLWKYEDTAPVLVSSMYEIATDEQMTACAGNNYGELTIKYRDPDVSEDEIKISTLNFILKVELSPETGGLVSLSEINNLNSQIALIVDQQLSNYYTKDEIDDQIETIVSEQVTPIVSDIVSEQVPPIVQSELGNYYTKTETDDYFYNKTETDNLLDNKANTSDLPDMDDYYDKSETDTLLSSKVSNSTLNNYYTKSEVDALVGTFDIIDSASGAIATFNDGGDNIPLKSCEVAIVAQQASGTPSPSNPRAISGFDSVDVLVGINIWDEDWEVGTINNSTGQNQDSTTEIRSKGYIRVTPNTSYYFRASEGSFKYVVYDANKNFIDYFIRSRNSVQTMGSNAYYIRITLLNYGTTYNNDISINYPSTDTAYHHSSLYSCILPSTCYGGTAELVNGNGIKPFGYVDLGSLSWIRYSDNKFYATFDCADFDHNNVNGMMCEVYPPITPSQWANKNRDYGILHENGQLEVLDIRYTTASDLTTALNGYKLVYPLATPTTFTFTGANIPTLSGENNIYSNCGDVKVEYFNDKADQLVALYNVLGGI